MAGAGMQGAADAADGFLTMGVDVQSAGAAWEIRRVSDGAVVAEGFEETEE